jgi:hypothetical protein
MTNARRRRDPYATCPNCHQPFGTQHDYVRHLLEEAGSNGVTTNEFLRAGAGSRFGARIHELRHQDGLYITEVNELYTLVGHVDRTETATLQVSSLRARREPAAADERDLVWRCLRCPIDERTATGATCARGHAAVLTWLIDVRPSAGVAADLDHDELAEAA